MASYSYYAKQASAPALRPGDVVVMDDLSTHHLPKVREAIESAGATPLRLPPYLPEFKCDRDDLVEGNAA